jgi:hypothetical protein
VQLVNNLPLSRERVVKYLASLPLVFISCTALDEVRDMGGKASDDVSGLRKKSKRRPALTPFLRMNLGASSLDV